MTPSCPTVRFTGLIAAFMLLAGLPLSAENDRPSHVDRLVLLDGSVITGTVTAIDAKGVVSVEGAKQPVELNGLRQIERPAVASNQSGRPAKQDEMVVIDLVGGGRLFADAVTIKDDRCQIRWPLADNVSFPIDAIRALRFERKPDAAFEKAFAAPGDEHDQLFAKVDGKLAPIEGLIESLDDKNVVFEWKGEQRVMPRSKLYGVVVAFVGRPPGHAGQALVELADGSSLWAKIVSLTQGNIDPDGAGNPLSLLSGKLDVRLSGGSAVALPWGSVARLTVRSTRLIYLSDLKPVEVIEEPIVAFPRSWQRDKSIGGRTLTLAGREYRKGLGVQAGSMLTFDTDEKYLLLTATIGIDAETAGRGDCVFVVSGDGKELFRQRVKGNDPPRPVRIDVSGVQRLSLLVEAGENLDLSDHADWCDACLIRPSK